ncbi:hypothetical protein KM295_05585 [Natronomonas sp. F2-12]|jgi:hypothetical protein|uniref:Uncharacterized protein n=1 Tax=Natronomonas aquatica TaxID=2841590 RepID=A0A9R1CQ45_9EURY|nr:hypothetical protein [Natronomonas aquatica]MCQ4332978.1 hypothetical protein [Natronomonas aquatica]
MRRRQFLASGTALLSVVVAGCGHPSVVLDLDEATAGDIADKVSARADPGSEEHTVVTSAIENGSSTRTGRYELFDRTDTVRVGDAFYTVSETRLESSEVTVYEVLVDFDPEDATPDLGEIEYADLPETDRQRLEPIISEDPPQQEGYDIGIGYGTAEEVGNGSVFVPERQYDIVVHDGTRYRIAVDSRTAPQAEYRYEVTEVAPDVETFAEQVRSQYLFRLSGLSAAEREVIEAAIDGGYFEDDEAFRSVTDRIREHEGLEVDDFYGTWLYEYETVEYLTYVEW